MIIIAEYLTLKKLNLKNKKYSFRNIQDKDKDENHEILSFFHEYIYIM